MVSVLLRYQQACEAQARNTGTTLAMGSRQMGHLRSLLLHSLQHDMCPHSRNTVSISASMHTMHSCFSTSTLAGCSCVKIVGVMRGGVDCSTSVKFGGGALVLCAVVRAYSCRCPIQHTPSGVLSLQWFLVRKSCSDS